MNEELKQEILAYLYKRELIVHDALCSKYIHLVARKLGKLFDTYTNDLQSEELVIKELISKLENYR